MSPLGTSAMVRGTDPDTSHIAAESFDAAAMEMAVYEVIRSFTNGCIADDVEQRMPGCRSHSITPRFAPLIRKGLIVDTGRRMKALSGRPQRVVMATSLIEELL